MTKKVGNVSAQRWSTLVRDARGAVETLSRCQFQLGDIALEIEPIQPVGGAHGENVGDTLRRFAEEIGEEYATLISHRAVAAAWPRKQRHANVSWSVHRALAPLPDRFEVIKDPPVYEPTGELRWTYDAAARRAGWTPTHPRTPSERLNRIHDLSNDDTVAVAAVSDMLRRPEVAHRVVADPTTRHLLHRAQIDRAEQVHEQARARTPMVRKLEQSIEVVSLLGACTAYVAAVNRLMPRLGEQRLSNQERAALHDHLDRVRAAADWCETVIDTGDVSMDAQLAALLRDGGTP